MVSLIEVHDRALQLARAQLGEEVKNVVVEDDIDLDGRPCLRVTVILKSQWSVDPPGVKLGHISLELSDFLVQAGDQRFPYTHYVTAREYSTSFPSDDRRTTTHRRRKAAR